MNSTWLSLDGFVIGVIMGVILMGLVVFLIVTIATYKQSIKVTKSNGDRYE